MQGAWRWVGNALTVVGLVGVSGCGGSSETEQSTAEAKVAGTVKVHNFPMQAGEIVFIPSATGRKIDGSRSAKVKMDGTFEVTTLVGRNEVRITGPALKKEPTLGYVTKTVDVESSGTTAHLEFP